MIACNIIIVRGCIHTPFMMLQMGTDIVMVECPPLREFIRVANDIGLYQAIELGADAANDREMLTFIYEEFKDAL